MMVDAGTHSFLVFATYILGQTQFPEFSLVLMLDDVQVGYYDSVQRIIISRRHNSSDSYDPGMEKLSFVFEDIYISMQKCALSLKQHFNFTDGVHVHQRLAGCEMKDVDNSGQIQSWDAFNGEMIEGVLYDVPQDKMQSKTEWFNRGHAAVTHIKWLYRHVYHPICIKTLKKYLHLEKNNVMRKVKPRVRVLRKTLPDSGGVQLSCLATGFYPRHINLTLFRDGQPVAEDQITGGMLLPNGDGTYQMRKSLEISAEEHREKHSYTCTATHLSLDNKLDIRLEDDLGPPVVSIVTPVLIVLVCLMVVMAVIIQWRRRCSGSLASLQSKYSDASSTEENESPANSTPDSQL